MESDAGENLRVGFGALGLESNFTVGDGLPGTLENQYDIEGGTAAGAGEEQFHWPGGKIASAGLRCAIHGKKMTAAGPATKLMPSSHLTVHSIRFSLVLAFWVDVCW